MRKYWTLIVISSFCIANVVFNTVLAWQGSHVSLITLAVLSGFVTVIMCGFGIGWKQALEGWGQSTEGWGAAQTWGIAQDTILHDALKELWEFDEEAVEIHNGRSATASLEYLKTFQGENEGDMAEVTSILKNSMRLR